MRTALSYSALEEITSSTILFISGLSILRVFKEFIFSVTETSAANSKDYYRAAAKPLFLETSLFLLATATWSSNNAIYT